MAGGGGGEGEINLVPYMDIMLNLVMFMLVITVQDFQMAEILTPASRASGGAGATPQNSAKEPPKPVLRVIVEKASVKVLVENPAEGVKATDAFIRADSSAATLSDKAWKEAGEYASKLVEDYGPKDLDENGQPKVMDVRMVVDPSVPYQEVVRGFDALRDSPKAIATVVLETMKGQKAKK